MLGFVAEVDDVGAPDDDEEAASEAGEFEAWEAELVDEDGLDDDDDDDELEVA